MGKKKIIKQPDEIRKAMEQRICADISMFPNVDHNSALHIRRLALALYHGGTCLPMYRTEAKSTAKTCLSGMDKEVFSQTLQLLFGVHEASDLLEILKMRVKGNLTDTIFRAPFHSRNPEDYIDRIILPTIFRWICGCGCDITVNDWLMDQDIVVSKEFDIADRLALELSRNSDVADIVMMIFNGSEDAPRPVSTEIFQAVIRSGFEPGIHHMKQMLCSPHTDTKLKEDILDVIDEGTADLYIDFMEWIYQEKLYRSALVSRKIDTWLWMGFGTLEPKMTELILKDCLKMLREPQQCYLALEKGDMLKVHIALWALAVQNIRQTGPVLWDMIQSVVPDQDLNQKINAIYFITHVQHEYLDFDITLELLESVVHAAERKELYGEPMELLAWLMPNLIPTNLEQRLNSHIQDRQHYFSLLEHVLHLIGMEERIFCGKPFAWTMVRLTPELAVEAMLRVASISKDRSMIRALARNFDYFTPKQRGYFYEYLLDPMHWREDEFFLREHQKDRSSVNRQVIAIKLEAVKEELERTKYHSNRW